MRTSVRVIAAGVIFFSLLAGMPAVSQETLENPDFSAGLTGWTLWRPLELGGGTVGFSPSSEGGGAGRITASSPSAVSTADGILAQCVTVVPGNWYSGFAQSRTISASGDAHFFLYVVWSPGSLCAGSLSAPGKPFLYEQAEFSHSTAWTDESVSGTVPAGAGSASYQLASLVIGAGTADALFDNASFVSAGPNSAPVARFTFSPVLPRALETVQFADMSPGGPTSWSWTFGDDGMSTAQNPRHTFGPGTYQVSLTVSNARGSSTKTQTVVVSTEGATVCTADAYTMCMVGGRYKVTSRWKNQYSGGMEATLSKAQLTDTTGAFWLSDSNTYEYLIRINTATDNGRAWIAIPTFTDVEFWIAVTDTTGGQYYEYHSPAGNKTLIYDPFYFVYP